MADVYTYPNSLVLKNKFDERDQQQLDQREADYTAVRVYEIQGGIATLPEPGFARLRAIHSYIFQDVYEWAGKPRITPLFKRHYVDHPLATTFVDPSELHREAERVFGRAASANQFQNLSRSEFVEKAAEHFADINELHIFREGNGRAQREYMRLLAVEAGHTIEFDGVSKERMVAVSIAASGIDRDLGPMCELFEEITHPGRAKALRKAAQFLETVKNEMQADWNEFHLATVAQGIEYQGDFVVGNCEDFIFVTRNERNAVKAFYIGDACDLPKGGLKWGQHVKFCATRSPG